MSYWFAMKTRFSACIAPLAVVLSLAAAAQDGVAGTMAFVTGGLLSGGVETCLKDIKAAAAKAGFTEFQETLFDDDKKAADFHADQKQSPLHLTARCDPKTGVWSVAVSGIDAEKTLEGYNRFFEALD
jgi:hypothetical protein